MVLKLEKNTKMAKQKSILKMRSSTILMTYRSSKYWKVSLSAAAPINKKNTRRVRLR